MSYIVSEDELLLTEIKTELLIIRYRIFTGRVSYFNLGLGRRKIGIAYEVQTAEADYDVDAEVVSLVGELSFGTKLNFGNFTVGVDWLGVHIPLRQISTSDSFPDGVDEAERKYSKEDFDKISSNTNGQFVRPYIGYKF